VGQDRDDPDSKQTMIRPAHSFVPRVDCSSSNRLTVRVGAVQYLNTKPLIHGLANRGLDLSFDLPSRLADRLATGSLDIALVPSVELFRQPNHRIVSDACIACRGPVMSVKLLFRTSPDRVTSLAMDEGSRTSAALARILLAERYGIRPRTEVLPIGSTSDETNADAVLLIGDRALGPADCSGAFQLVWDLGDEWCRWTGLPFVFAVWAARPEADVAGMAEQLNAARDAGKTNLAAIAAAEAGRHGLTVPQCLGYLRDNLHYDLGERELEALRLFRRFASQLGLVPQDSNSSAPFAAQR
jgi:chorismate dehydratase